MPTGMARRARPAVGHPLKDSPLVPRGTTWLVNERGQPFTARAFSKWFGKRCRDAATAPISPRATEGGHATDGRGRVVRAQMGAWSGHDSKREVACYTAAASQDPYDKACPGAQTGNMGLVANLTNETGKPRSPVKSTELRARIKSGRFAPGLDWNKSTLNRRCTAGQGCQAIYRDVETQPVSRCATAAANLTKKSSAVFFAHC